MDEFVAAIVNGIVILVAAFVGTKLAFWHDNRVMNKRLDKSAARIQEMFDAHRVQQEGEDNVS